MDKRAWKRKVCLGALLVVVGLVAYGPTSQARPDEVIPTVARGYAYLADGTQAPLGTPILGVCGDLEVSTSVDTTDGHYLLSFEADCTRESDYVHLYVDSFDYEALGSPWASWWGSKTRTLESDYPGTACEAPEITSLTASSPAKEGEPVQFTATVDGSQPVNYDWDFGGPGTGTGTDTATPTFTYDNSGSYTVTLSVENACGTDSEVLMVEVCEQPVITDITSDSPVLESMSMHFNATVEGTEPMSYTWDFGAPGTATDADTLSPAFAYENPGTYTVTLTAENGCGSDVETLVVEVLPDCHPVEINDLTSNSPVSFGDTVYFTATIGGYPVPSNYNWSFGGTGIGTGGNTPTPSFAYSSAGTYTVTLVVTNACSSDTGTLVVVVNPSTVAPARIRLAADPTSLLVTDSSTVTATVYDASDTPLSGQVVTFTTRNDLGGGAIAPGSGTTDGEGEMAVLVSSTVTGTKEIVATADNGVTGTVDVTFVAAQTVYLPVVLLGHESLPDLRITGISLDPADVGVGEAVTIQVTVENVGPSSAGPFWVDLYLDPNPAPTAANQPWSSLCVSGEACHGIAWEVEGGLAAGGSIVLSSADVDAGDDANWPGYLADTGVQELYAFTDSRGGGGSDGAVREANEGLDNRFGPVTVNVEGTCRNVLINGGFESSDVWQLHNASYSTDKVTEGVRSLLTGILPPGSAGAAYPTEESAILSGRTSLAVPNAATKRMNLDLATGIYSSGSQEVEFPDDAVIRLRYWSYPICELRDPADFHYVILEDEEGTDRWIQGDRRDTRAWEWYEHDLTVYRGQTVRLFFGSYNDGDCYETAMFFDDVVLEVCEAGGE